MINLLLSATLIAIALVSPTWAEKPTPKLIKMNGKDINGNIFQRSDMVKTTSNGNTKIWVIYSNDGSGLE